MPLPKKINGTDPRVDPLSLGNLALDRGYITTDQLRAALQEQEKRLPLGKILVKQGALTNAQLEELLLDQKIMKLKLSPTEGAKLIRERRREKMKEVVQELRETSLFLTNVPK